jgi:SAM-dependent methyltransferase
MAKPWDEDTSSMNIPSASDQRWRNWKLVVETERDIVSLLPFKKVHIIDNNYFLCSRYVNNHGRGIVTCGDIRDMPYDFEMFDAIFDLSTIDHIPEVEALHVLGAYCDRLKYGGILVLLFTHRQLWHRIRGLHDNGSQYYFDSFFRNVVYRLFDVKEEHYVGTLQVTPLISRVSRRIPRLLNRMVKLEYGYGRRMFSEQHLIICCKTKLR